MSILLSILGSIPGLAAILERLGIGVAAYAKGRSDATTNARLAQAEAKLDSIKRQQAVPETQPDEVVEKLRRGGL